jgi:hypothetical protein
MILARLSFDTGLVWAIGQVVTAYSCALLLRGGVPWGVDVFNGG